MKVYGEEPVVEVLYARGERLRALADEAARDAGVSDYFQVVGRLPNLVYVTRDASVELSQSFRTLFLQEMVARSFIVPSFVVSYAHSDHDIERTAEAIAESLVTYRRGLEHGVEQLLRGPSVQPVYRRRN